MVKTAVIILCIQVALTASYAQSVPRDAVGHHPEDVVANPAELPLHDLREPSGNNNSSFLKINRTPSYRGLLSSQPAFNTNSDSTSRRSRIYIVSAGNVLFWTGSYIALNKAWYSNYERTGFHFFNDNSEWNQVDKAGHLWTTYQISRASTRIWNWAGVNPEAAAFLGAGSGVVYQSIIEIQDAFSASWGFSWGDMAANIAGAGLFVLQERLWEGQRLSIKMSYWPRSYPAALHERRNEIFGKSLSERILKDYNAQTFWVSANLASFFPRQSGIPRWLNLAIGYGAEGLLGARENVWRNREGQIIDYSSTERMRNYYLSPDIDLTAIKTGSKFLRSVFFVLNAVKIPAPALVLSNKGTLKVAIR